MSVLKKSGLGFTRHALNASACFVSLDRIVVPIAYDLYGMVGQ